MGEPLATIPRSSRTLLGALGTLAVGAALGFSARRGGAPLVALAAMPAVYVAIERCAPRKRDAALVGFAFGLGFALFTVDFVSAAYARLPSGGLLTAVALRVLSTLATALPPAVGAAAYAGVRREASPFVFVLAFATAFEVVPMPFPWQPIAMALDASWLAASLAYGGTWLGDLVLGASVIGFVPLEGARPKNALVSAAVAACFLALGHGRVHALREEARAERPEGLVVGVVQPAVQLAEARDRGARAGRITRLRDATAALVARGAELVVWPESAHPFGFDRAAVRDLPPPRDTGAARARVPVVVGAETRVDGCTRWNGAVALDADGAIVDHADKERRMPFGDYVPLVEHLSRASACASLRPAAEHAPLSLEGRPGTLVCYDEVEAWPARRAVRGGAGFLVTLTNDAWYVGTAQPRLQELHARMRALETGRELVRAANLEGSQFIAADGRIRGELARGARTSGLSRVVLRNETTVAVRLGAWPTALAALVVAAAVLQRARSSGSGGR